jgi:3-oxoacyl-[acyl-carrier protein] reductase
MDLGLRGKTALVCAASKGLGRACAEALAAEGVNLVITARGDEALQAAAEAIRQAHQVKVIAVAGDITTPAGRADALAQMRASLGEPDILVNNAGGPKFGDFQDWEREDWIAALDANMLTPIALIKALTPHMKSQAWGRVINITSGAVKAPIPELGLSNGARSGLTGFVAGLSRQIAQHGVTINNLLPGPFLTDRLTSNFELWAKQQGKSAEEVAKARSSLNPMKRFGNPPEFGAFCAFLCSQQAAYMTGQNILLDGGHFPGMI